MMKKTCPVLLAIAHQRSRLPGVIIEHHAAANMQWGTCAPAQSSPIAPAKPLGRLSVKRQAILRRSWHAGPSNHRAHRMADGFG